MIPANLEQGKIMQCLFCNEQVDHLFTGNIIDQVLICPRCGAEMILVESTEKLPDWNNREVLLRKQDNLYLAVSWDGSEELTTAQVGQIIGKTTSRVTHLVAGDTNPFPNAKRKSTRPMYKKGHWRIPRKDVYRYLNPPHDTPMSPLSSDN